jgi:hypothetical protein
LVLDDERSEMENEREAKRRGRETEREGGREGRREEGKKGRREGGERSGQMEEIGEIERLERGRGQR